MSTHPDINIAHRRPNTTLATTGGLQPGAHLIDRDDKHELETLQQEYRRLQEQRKQQVESALSRERLAKLELRDAENARNKARSVYLAAEDGLRVLEESAEREDAEYEEQRAQLQSQLEQSKRRRADAIAARYNLDSGDHGLAAQLFQTGLFEPDDLSSHLGVSHSIQPVMSWAVKTTAELKVDAKIRAQEVANFDEEITLIDRELTSRIPRLVERCNRSDEQAAILARNEDELVRLEMQRTDYENDTSERALEVEKVQREVEELLQELSTLNIDLDASNTYIASLESSMAVATDKHNKSSSALDKLAFREDDLRERVPESVFTEFGIDQLKDGSVILTEGVLKRLRTQRTLDLRAITTFTKANPAVMRTIFHAYRTTSLPTNPGELLLWAGIRTKMLVDAISSLEVQRQGTCLDCAMFLSLANSAHSYWTSSYRAYCRIR